MTDAERIEQLQRENDELRRENEDLENKAEVLVLKLTAAELAVGAFSADRVGALMDAADEFLLWTTPEEQERFDASLNKELGESYRDRLETAVREIRVAGQPRRTVRG